MKHSSRQSATAFTLIEILVALLLLSMVIMIVVMATAAVMQGYDRLNAHQQRFEEMQRIDRTVEGIFTNIVPFTWRDDTNTSYTIFEGTDREVILTYLHPLNRLEDGALRFCYILQEDDKLIIYYAQRPPFPDSLNSPRLRRTVLATGIEDIVFSYGDLSGEDVIFVSDWQELNYIPLALQMKVVWEDGTVKTWLRRAGGTSYYERWGDWKQDPIR